MSYFARWSWPLLAVVLPLIATAGTEGARQPGCFPIFDATAYVGKPPDLRVRGFEPIQVIEPDRWWPPGDTHDDLPSPRAAQHWVADVRDRRGKLILDLER